MFKIRLRDARELSGYSVDDIAVICGINVEDVRLYEKDAGKMPFDLARAAKRLFHIQIEQIYLGLEAEYARND